MFLHLGLWILLSVFGIIIPFIVNHFLSADFRFLETWEHSFGQNVEWVMRRLGYDVRMPDRKEFGLEPVPHRSTALYVVLSIITAGLFTIYWRYAMMIDGNAHFDADDRMEDAILAGLGLTTGGYGFGAQRAGLPMPPPPAETRAAEPETPPDGPARE